MSCKLYLSEGVLRLDFFDVVTSGDLDDMTAAVTAIEAGAPIVPHRITDITGASTIELQFSDIDKLTEKRRATKFPNAFKSALVAPRSDKLGFARMFQILLNHPQITVRIFTDLASAEAWIAQD